MTVTEQLIALPDEIDISELIPLAYDELKNLARRFMRAEREGHSLQSTALVHETYLRLLGMEPFRGGDIRKFFALAARTMRRVLVNHARMRNAQKRGGDWERLPLEAIENEISERCGYAKIELIALDMALRRLAVVRPHLADTVELMFFVGLSRAETAEVLGVCRRTVDKYWDFARVWLIAEMEADARRGASRTTAGRKTAGARG